MTDEAPTPEPGPQGPQGTHPGHRTLLARAAARIGLRVSTTRQSLKSLFDLELTSYYLLVGAVLLLLGIGLIEVFSASTVNNLVNGRPMLSSIRNQAVSAGLGLCLMYVASRLPPRAYRALAYPALVGTVLLLLLVLAVGSSHNGNKNWLILGPLTVQPSEFAKLALVLWAPTSWSARRSSSRPGTTCWCRSCPARC